jgi:hypothetical protein
MCASDKSLVVFRLVIGAPESILLVESHQAGAGMGLRRLSGYLALTIAAASPAIGAAPSFGGCLAFPADNYWNTRVDNLAVHPSSTAWVNSIGATARLHPDCCNVTGEPYGFSPTAVPGTQPLVPITYYPTSPVSESDPGPFPIPPALAVGRYAGSSDREVVVVNAATCTLYELYGAPVSGGSSWIVDSSAKWDLRSNALRPEGHVSADRAGLPMLPGLMRWQEVAAGEIGHAIRFTASNIWGQVAGTGAMKYLWPARHGVGTSTDETLPPLGARLRLKASFDISGFDARTQVILRAFKKYGIVLSSGGGNWYLQGDDDALWPDSVVAELRSIAGGEFEVVDTAPMMVNVNSGQAVQLDAPPPPPPAGDDTFPPGGVPSGWIQPAGSNAAWVVANDAAFAGSLSLKAGFIAANQKSEIAYRGNFAAGNVTFARKVSGQAGAASLQFHIDGVQQAAWSGEQDWAVVAFAIPAGTHTLMWRFVKGAAGTSGSDAAWIDSVVLPARAKCRFPMGDRRCLVE